MPRGLLVKCQVLFQYRFYNIVKSPYISNCVKFACRCFMARRYVTNKILAMIIGVKIVVLLLSEIGTIEERP